MVFLCLIIVDFCRNGKQIDFLGLDENYNFDMQQIVNLGSIKTIKKVSFKALRDISCVGSHHATSLVSHSRVMRSQWSAPTILQIALKPLRWVSTVMISAT